MCHFCRLCHFYWKMCRFLWLCHHFDWMCHCVTQHQIVPFWQKICRFGSPALRNGTEKQYCDWGLLGQHGRSNHTLKSRSLIWGIFELKSSDQWRKSPYRYLLPFLLKRDTLHKMPTVFNHKGDKWLWMDM